MVLPAVLSVILLLWSVVGNLVIGDTGYVPRNLALTVVLLLVAKVAGLGADELGLARDRLGAGVRWGLLALGAVALALTAGVVLGDALGPLAALFDDERAQLGTGALMWTALVRIPVGTVVFEEIAFRGVLLAAMLRVTTTRRAVLWSSAVFGVWHVPPTIVALQLNDLAPFTVSGVLGIVAGVVVTALGGVVFALLRVRSGSLLAPMLAHLATNSLGLLAAWVTSSHG